MQHWNLNDLETPRGSRSPVVLRSDNNARAVLVALDAGQALRDHETKEGALVSIVEGSARIESGGETVEAGPGCVFYFEADERRSIASDSGARLLMVFSPWPGEGHYRGEAKSG